MLIARIRVLDPLVNSIVYLDEAYTLAMAAAAEARYRAGAPLSAMDGVPVTIKDLSAVAGMPRAARFADDRNRADERRYALRRPLAGGRRRLPGEDRDAGSRLQGRDPERGAWRNGQPLRLVEDSGRFVRWRGGGARARFRPGRTRQRRRRLHSHSGRLHQSLRHQAGLRPRPRISTRYRHAAFRRRTARPHRDRRRRDARYHQQAGAPRPPMPGPCHSPCRTTSAIPIFAG